MTGTEKQIQFATDLINKFETICSLAKNLFVKGEALEEEIEELNSIITKIKNEKISEKSEIVINRFKKIDDQIEVVKAGERINLYEINAEDFTDIDEAYDLGFDIKKKLRDFAESDWTY